MKKAVKITSVVLSNLVLAASMAGCSGNKEGGTDTSTVKDDGSPAEISIYFDTPRAGLDRANTDIFKEIQKRTNTKLTVIDAPTGQAVEKLNVLIATGQVPDIIRMDDANTYLKYINMQGISGVVQPLDDIMDKSMPNLKKSLNNDAKTKLKASDNKLYAAPTIGDTGYTTFFIRQDWLDNLKMSAPKTLDEYYNALKAFTENDPDGNGKKDTIGTSMIENLQWFELISGPFGLPLTGWIKADDGSLIYSPVSPKMKEALAFGIKLYKDGFMEREFGTTKRAQFDEKLYNNKYGVILSMSSSALKATTNLKKSIPAAKYVAFKPPVAPGIAKGIGTMSSIVEGTDGKSFIGLSAISKTTKQLDKVAKFIDSFYTEDMQNLQNYGLEGKHFTMQNGIPTFKPEYSGTNSENRLKEGLIDGFKMGGILDQKHIMPQLYDADTIKYMKSSIENSYPKTVFFSTPTGDAAGAEIDKAQKEYFSKIILGGLSLEDGWNQWLKEFDRLGGTKWTKEVNDTYKSIK
jgi:putative aldouronate transport system substrate-binding protein